MRRWGVSLILKRKRRIPEPSHQPVRLQMGEDICGIIQKMNRGILPVWTLISSEDETKKNIKKDPRKVVPPDCSYFYAFPGRNISGTSIKTRCK